ncbi:MAG: hypothetical protein LC667_16380 [Thioalkalivibrio sp.]|nr:hypothetical protein [Thioalkalivibrio sp.]
MEIPLWPEALARPDEGDAAEVLFASDTDDDLPPPVVATFYSLRGGVGRSTAVAYTARILAAGGFKVVRVDMDLEAPGLLTLFGKEAELVDDQGVVHLLIALDHGENPDISRHLIRVVERDDLYCLPAGRPSAEYARLLTMIDPAAWYREERNPMRDLLQRLETTLPFRPDAILFDARTGITPLSGPLLFDLSDLDILVMFPHPQAYAGTKALVSALLRANTRRSHEAGRLTPEPRFVASPIPASKAPEVVTRYHHRTLTWVAEWIEPVNRRRKSASPLVESEITAFIPYREAVATSDQILDDEDTWRDYAEVAGWIERFLPTETERRDAVTLDGEKSVVLRELRFSTGTAELQEDFLDTFVETDVVRRALDPNIPLVLGRKGTGKTSVFRRVSEDPQRPAVVVLAPRPLAVGKGWILGPEGFQSIEAVLTEKGTDWRQFWTFYVALAIQQTIPAEKTHNLIEGNGLLEGAFTNIVTELDVRNSFGRLSEIAGFGLELNALLGRLDEVLEPRTFILFDGLDTGFGSTESDRQRREDAISGLFAFWTDRGPMMQNARFKIVLREDIWRKVRFENKSHLYGRSVTLQWKDQASFYKVVVKQALQSPSFRALISDGRLGVRTTDLSLDDWTESQVFRAWNILVGERMKGGKTAFTRNWVWNRLADGNDDHSPRYLLQLFHAVAEWEKQEQRKAPYDRSVIRPRAFTAIFPQVSEQALEALLEEMPEMTALLDALRLVGRTPVPAEELTKWDDEVELAREVGLLSVYEGTSDRVERYKVPEIYRHALNMSRKGQM